uniref:Uncharacterized protein n=1 Tax=Arundo donax TaxID=35708 RepID=A0A0A9ARE6_ARUDO
MWCLIKLSLLHIKIDGKSFSHVE